MNYSTNWIQTIMVRLRSRNICRSAHQHQTTVGISDTPLHPPRYLACYCSSIYCSMKLFLVYSVVDQQYVSSLQYLNFCVVFSLSPESVFFLLFNNIFQLNHLPLILVVSVLCVFLQTTFHGMFSFYLCNCPFFSNRKCQG